MRAKEFDRVTEDCRWLDVANQTIQGKLEIDPEEFSTYWVVAGHRIREQISNDITLVKLLKGTFPPYQGGEQLLYRGENLQRYRSGVIGMAWTTEVGVAQMFGRGLNSCPGGGVLLKAKVSSEAIICEPNHHSKHLGEHQYTIDPFQEIKIELVEHYPECR
jgi:hypothetical protein